MKSAEMPSLSTGASTRAHVVRMKMAADEANLQASVPLLPQKARTKVPLLLYASQVGVPTSPSQVICCCRYALYGWPSACCCCRLRPTQETRRGMWMYAWSMLPAWTRLPGTLSVAASLCPFAFASCHLYRYFAALHGYSPFLLQLCGCRAFDCNGVGGVGGIPRA